MSESQEKEIEVERRGDFKPGDRVIIEGAGWQGLAATWWAYVLPVLLVLTTLIITYTISGREGLAGLFSLLILLPYYLVLKISDKIMSKSFHFTIKQVNE
jgi:sigma-E factor negative regulatory protein RseC